MNQSHQRRTRCILLTLFASLLSLGCGDDGGGPAGEAVGCDWFMGENCWRVAANEFAACASDSPGSFDAAATTCTTPDGGRVSFASPVPANIDVDDSWDFTVENAGTPCGHYQSDDGGVVLTTMSGEVRVSVGQSSETITCPDGSKHSIPILGAFECLFDLPGISWFDGDSLSVSLVGADDGAIFECSH